MSNREISVGRVVALLNNPVAMPARKQPIMLTINVPYDREQVGKIKIKQFSAHHRNTAPAPPPIKTEMNAVAFAMIKFACV